MRIGVPREVYSGEKRVATTPDTVEKLIKLGFSVSVESGAGVLAHFSDEEYQKSGAEIVTDLRQLYLSVDLVFKVRGPSPEEVSLLKEGTILVSFVWPAQNKELMNQMMARNLTVLAMDSIPRISRAQKCDALSSMANIAGYRAVIEAAHHFGRFFTGQITAAGKVPPAKVFVIGAGVAGLAAIGAASGLGAIVRANDTRPEVADQVKSMGGEFVPVSYQEEGSGIGGYAKVMSEGYLKAQKEVFFRQAREADVIVTTALIPGKSAPCLITAEMVRAMKAGSVIVDLAAEQGGNCELTVPGEVVVRHGVTIIGYTDLPSRLAKQASTLYGTNLYRLIEELCPQKNGSVFINMEDEMIRGAVVIKEGSLTWPPPAPKVSVAPLNSTSLAGTTASSPAVVSRKKGRHGSNQEVASPLGTALVFGGGGLLLYLVGLGAPAAFLSHLTVFVLACFVGYMVVWNVTAALHTPLMSVTNAISSIIVIGALVQISSSDPLIVLLSSLAIVFTAINMFGGFAVTQRMLSMFKK